MSPHKPCGKRSVNDFQFHFQGVERLKTIPFIRKRIDKVNQRPFNRLLREQVSSKYHPDSGKTDACWGSKLGSATQCRSCWDHNVHLDESAWCWVWTTSMQVLGSTVQERARPCFHGLSFQEPYQAPMTMVWERCTHVSCRIRRISNERQSKVAPPHKPAPRKAWPELSSRWRKLFPYRPLCSSSFPNRKEVQMTGIAEGKQLENIRSSRNSDGRKVSHG